MVNLLLAVGVVSECIYELDCEFADPTVKFRGVQRYKNNLQASHRSQVLLLLAGSAAESL